MIKSWLKILSVAALLCWQSGVCLAQEFSEPIINSKSYDKIISYLLVSKDDITTYKKMFRALEKEDFAEFASLQKKLENHVLLGSVLAEKYLHPKYKSSLQELSSWLEEYNSYPQAKRVYLLAKRKTKTPEDLKKPIFFDDTAPVADAESVFVNAERAKFRGFINKGKTLAARRVLENPRFRKSAPNQLWDELAATLALKYLVDNNDKLAYEWASRASKRQTSGVAVWVGGLASWRMKNYKNAADFFERLALSKNPDEWLVSAGGYWAYRAYDKLGNKNKAQKMLASAAKYKHTFYGVLAAHKLGQTVPYNWSSIAYFNDFNNYDYIYELLGSEYIRRALLLIHAKQTKQAELELRFGYSTMNDKQKEAVIFIADQYDMHALAIYLANQNKNLEENKTYDNVAYPLPQWLPMKGWKVDKSLVLGLVRQESAFQPNAVSHAGAKGLMQLMPNTAYHITKDIRLKSDKTRLFKSEYNLKLGQQYISYLFDKPFVQGNLFYMITAYNAGPGNLVKWQKSARYNDDALLFIEVIPSAETRIYIERVMANYWIYNMRFGVENPSLEQLAKGEWPVLQ